MTTFIKYFFVTATLVCDGQGQTDMRVEIVVQIFTIRGIRNMFVGRRHKFEQIGVKNSNTLLANSLL